MFKNFFKNKKILVTGHTGFQGSWLTLWLHQLGAQIIGYSLEPPTKPSFFKSLKIENEITHIIDDIRNLDRLKNIFLENKPEIVFHLAAQPLVRESYKNPLETFSTNIIGTTNILECLKTNTSVKQCIIYTSDKSYENQGHNQPFVETDRLGGNDPYSASKACAEIITSSYRNSFFKNTDAPNISTVRAGNVIGGGDWANDRLIPDFIRAVQQKQKLSIRNPNHTRPWQYVLEPLAGILHLAEKMSEDKNLSGPWNFGPPLDTDDLTVQKLLELFCNKWGIDHSILEYENNDQPHEDQFLKIDPSKAGKLLQLKTVFNTEKTITETVEWYKNYISNNEDLKSFSQNQINKFVNSAKELDINWIDKNH